MNIATPMHCTSAPRVTMRKAHPSREAGMALIVVLWLVVLLSVMAAGHSRNVHADTMLAARQVGLAKARALAEAGAHRAIIDLLGVNDGSSLPVDGTFSEVDIFGHGVNIAIRDATGLVDLNMAGADLLYDLLSAAGTEQFLRRNIVDAILDWRDGDDLRHLHGAEDDDYIADDVGWTVRDGPFTAVEELKYVKGVSQDLFDRLVPLVTVHSGRPGVNVEYAPKLLASALVGDSDGRSRPLPAINTPATARRTSQGARNGTYHVYVTAEGAAQVVASLEVVVRISSSSEEPFTILERREPMRARLSPNG